MSRDNIDLIVNNIMSRDNIDLIVEQHNVTW